MINKALLTRSFRQQSLVLVLAGLCQWAAMNPVLAQSVQVGQTGSGLGAAQTGAGSSAMGLDLQGLTMPSLPAASPQQGRMTSGMAGVQNAAGLAEIGQGTGPTGATAPADLAKPTPNQFQRFVQQATGQELPLYGFNLFSGPRFQSLANVPVPANYVLGPGDDVDLKIWGMADFAARLTVDRNGQITIPRVGTVTVAGTRADQLEKQLKTQVGRVFNNFELSATLGRLRSIQVYVVGQARKPGAYTVSGLSTLISVLFESGGPAATGTMRKIQLVRGGQSVSTLDLYEFIHSGKTTGDAPLQPGDVIVIPPAGPRVAVTGALDTPAIYELAGPQESLQSLLAYTGGLQVLATPHKALLERIQPANATAPRAVQEIALDASGMAQPLRDGDVLWLFPISPQFGNAITLRGNVAAPLRYSHKPGMRVSDLIPEPAALIQSDYYQRKNIIVQHESGKRVAAERVISEVKNLLEEINWDYASIERLDVDRVKTTLLPFNLGKAIKDRDPLHNLELQPGDVLTVYGVTDLPVPMEKRTQFVRLGGEVRVPGLYQISPGETLPQLLAKAGGFTANAYPYATVFTRESTRREQQSNLDRAIRKLEQDINGQAASQLQNVTDSEKGSALQAQLAGQRILLGRLQNLRATGRISLEMAPNETTWPPVTLEDGDTIVVPHKPSFVGVFGAVNAESSFIHRPGTTVSEYIEKAGPGREADLDAAMLIRADGSVLSNKSSRSWLGLGNSAFMSTRVNPGDSVFVPEVLDRRNAYTVFMQGAKDWTSILYQFGLGAAALKTLRN